MLFGVSDLCDSQNFFLCRLELHHRQKARLEKSFGYDVSFSGDQAFALWIGVDNMEVFGLWFSIAVSNNLTRFTDDCNREFYPNDSVHFEACLCYKAIHA